MSEDSLGAFFGGRLPSELGSLEAQTRSRRILVGEVRPLCGSGRDGESGLLINI